MDNDNKNNTPREQYRRRRRVFSDHGELNENKPEDTGEEQATDEAYGYKDTQDHHLDEEDTTGESESASVNDSETPDEEHSAAAVNRSSKQSNGKNKRNGAGRAFFLPLIAGMIGALIILLGFHYLTDGDNEGTDASNDSTETAEEIEETQAELDESTDDGREVSDTTAAIQVARESVVSVINLQRADQFLPGLNQDPTAEPEEAGIGSGVIYKLTDDSAYIVTNHHVVEGAEELQINMENGDTLTGELVGSDIWTDLAVIRVDSGNIENTVPFGDSDDLLVGEEAIAIGSPLGEAFSGSVSQGIVSGLDRSVPVDLDGDGSYDWEANVIQTDAAINPGNSGGALINSSGELIGVNSMKISMPTVEGIGFAIPANEVEKITSQIEENGEVVRPFLGVSLQDLYTIPNEIVVNQMNVPDDVNSGVVVSNIQEGSPAANAGIEQLDLVVALDGSEVSSMMELRQYLYYEKQPGDNMEVTFYRQGEEQTVNIVLE